MPEFASGGIIDGPIGPLVEPGCPSYTLPAAMVRKFDPPFLAQLNAGGEAAVAAPSGFASPGYVESSPDADWFVDGERYEVASRTTTEFGVILDFRRSAEES